MPKILRHIEIVRSPNKLLSSMSIASAQLLSASLKETYSNVVITEIQELKDLDDLILRSPDLVFLGMKKIIVSNKTIWLADYFDSFGILCTGSAKNAHALELDKSLAKSRVSKSNVKTAPFFVSLKGEDIKEDINISYPVFIKPVDRGGGEGIDNYSLAHDFTQLKDKTTSLSNEYNADSLIEEYLYGREFSVAVLREPYSNELQAMPLELIAPQNSMGDRFLSSEIKSADTEKFVGLEDGELKEAVSDLALQAFKALGARDYGRIDIRLDVHGVPNFLEANLMPSILKDYGNFLKACLLNDSISYKETILRIVNLAFERENENLIADEVNPFLVSTATIA